MTKTYVIADLHGRVDILDATLAEIERREPGTVLFTGDYVDRGPASRQVLDRLFEGPPEGWRWVQLLGNHEEMMLEACRSREATWARYWLQNGGGNTLISYGHELEVEVDLSVVPSAHLAWLESLPLLYEDAHRIYVHAGVNPTTPLAEQTRISLLWMCYPRRHADIGFGHKHVVHGHDSHVDGPVMMSNRTNLDTCAWETGRLVVGVFDDDRAGGPVDLIEIRRPPIRQTPFKAPIQAVLRVAHAWLPPWVCLKLCGAWLDQPREFWASNGSVAAGKSRLLGRGLPLVLDAASGRRSGTAGTFDIFRTCQRKGRS